MLNVAAKNLEYIIYCGRDGSRGEWFTVYYCGILSCLV